MAPVICAELFGQAHLGTIYNLVGLAPAAGSFAFSAGVASFFYRRAGAGSAGSGSPACPSAKPGVCFGGACYDTTFTITAATCVVGALLAAALSLRSAGFYRGLRE